MPYCLVKPFVFALDPETAHELTLAGLAALQKTGVLPAYRPLRASPVTVMGLEFPNRVGLAAGLDKNGEIIDALATWGFGFIEVGTVTPRPQPGNPRPRLFRLPEAQGIINRMGFNNRGVDTLVANVRTARFKGILGINIGKNFDTPIEKAADDYLACLDKVYALASYVAVNISSPNTKNLRQLQGESELDALLGALRTRQTELADKHGHYVPMALKIAPDLDEAQIVNIADALRRHRLDGVIATNTTLAREGVEHLKHGNQAGGLSGAPLFERSTGVLRRLTLALAGELPVIAAGGIVDGGKAKAKLDAGAALVQIYSGLVYKGPDLVGECIGATAGHNK
ncbi:MAG: quinone-dependent dihydroorotate dehydrogenase [Rhodocyclaceae bacterium]|nr:quinone-dependent dihydroorotate dehydrogenase [Rhodocyclaceae bacterium]MBK6553459.1 quinone-dependent dihydroorotate dehydrogenase [Rhodocyclaceae bacterium]MBK9311264.1 quinone-dependent dihydroorotate dehydrogenase [Rhodocyclaceae bacterium]